VPQLNSVCVWPACRQWQPKAERAAAVSERRAKKPAGEDGLKAALVPRNQDQPTVSESRRQLNAEDAGQAERPNWMLVAKARSFAKSLASVPRVGAMPEGMGATSYLPARVSDLEDQLELFLRRAQRRAQYDDPGYRQRREAEIKRRAGVGAMTRPPLRRPTRTKARRALRSRSQS
jgi:hypothetical protein